MNAMPRRLVILRRESGGVGGAEKAAARMSRMFGADWAVSLLCAGLGVDAIDWVILTHVHLDHAGGAGALMRQLPNARLKSKTAQRDGIEMTLELRLKDSETGFVEKLLKVDGVYDASLISYQGDIVA